MNTKMFREYDIRGIYGSDITPLVAKKIGKSFASYIDKKDVIIGHDNRLSSPEIHKNLIEGLLECGANIIDLGLCTTPMYYALKKHLKIKCGIMITASHNPKEYNGFKISFDESGNAFGKAIYDFRDFCQKEKYTIQKGSYTFYENTKEIYLNLIKKSIKMGPKKVKVVFDPANATGCVILKDILENFDFDYKIINEISDGNFPSHHPDPCVPENMQMLQKEVKRGNFDLGIGIDGDADRVGVVDDKGIYHSIDKIMILLYKYLLPNFKEKKAIMDVKCSKAVIDEMQSLNVPLEIYRTGNSYMNHKINSEKYDFGGEFSGHIWFTDKWPGFDDGIYGALRIIEMLSYLDKPLSELIEKLPKYYNTPEIKIEVNEEEKEYILETLKEHLINQNIAFNDIDGIRIDLSDGFCLIRKSNTGPHLTLRFEKKSQKALEEIKNEYLTLVNNIIASKNH